MFLECQRGDGNNLGIATEMEEIKSWKQNDHLQVNNESEKLHDRENVNEMCVCVHWVYGT